MALQARLAASQASNRRTSPRRTLHLHSTIAGDGEDVVIHDLSNTGLLLETRAGLSEGQRLDVDLPDVGLTHATVIWSSGHYFGCRFKTPVSKAALSAALLRNPIARSEPVGENPDGEAAGTNEFSFAVKMRVIIGVSLALWALILWAVGLF